MNLKVLTFNFNKISSNSNISTSNYNISSFRYNISSLYSNNSSLYEKNTVFLAILTGKDLPDQNKYVWDNFIPQFSRSPFYGGYGFFAEKNLSFEDGLILHGPPDIGVDKSSGGLVSKSYEALYYFLMKSRSSWFLRVTIDTSINLRTFPLLLAEVNNETQDPNNEFVLKGNCVTKWNFTYIQGGSGILLSRKAAYELFTKDWEWFQYLSNYLHQDDKLYAHYLPRKNISFYNVTSRWFSGHNFHQQRLSIDLLRNKTKVRCPKRPKAKRCRPFFTRFKDVVLLHQMWTNFSDFYPYVDEYRKAADDNLYFYYSGRNPNLCFSDHDISGYYD